MNGFAFVKERLNTADEGRIIRLCRLIIYQLFSLLGGALLASVDGLSVISPFGVAFAVSVAPKYLISACFGAAAGPTEPLHHGDPCDCLVWQKTDLGFKAIINNRYQGQIYDNQIFQPLHSGNRLTAYIDHVRQDGKIDITLQPTGRQHTLDFAEVLLRYLYENDGYCDLGDKSDAELIYDRFKVSKKAYKKAIGDLYRRRLIVIEEEGIRLA